MDDIVVHGATMEVHDRRLKDVFQHLKDFNLVLNQQKCQVGVPEIEFLVIIFPDKEFDQSLQMWKRSGRQRHQNLSRNWQHSLEPQTIT